MGQERNSANTKADRRSAVQKGKRDVGKHQALHPKNTVRQFLGIDSNVSPYTSAT